jgi:SEC-C motif-containing protein
MLMRSRFTAFARNDSAYLLRTWHPATRPGRVHLDPDQRWLGLHILRTTGGGLLDTGGTVEFRADYVVGGHAGVMREHSRFIRHHGLWVYLGPVPVLPA